MIQRSRAEYKKGPYNTVSEIKIVCKLLDCMYSLNESISDISSSSLTGSNDPYNL